MDAVLDIDHLTEADLPGMLALSAEAGWNQTADDWRLFLDLGRVVGIRDGDGRPVASAAIMPYGRFAWISMVLVTAPMRRHGLGTKLLNHCITALRWDGIVPLLDATAAGEKVYLPLGFRPLGGITRWQGQGGPDGGSFGAVLPLEESQLPAAVALDAAVFGAPRASLLRSFRARAPHLALRLKEHGIVVARPGRLATQIGPLAASDEGAALALLRAALARATGPVFLDVPDRWTGLAAELQRRGFTIQRSFRRMALADRPPVLGDAARGFVIAGPEFG